MSLLHLRNVTVERGHVAVLHGIDCAVGAGEIVSILGSNGAGKSTTLRTISGLHRPTSGSIEFEGERIDRLSPRRIVQAGISHVPEGRQVFPALTVRENLEMGAYVHPRRFSEHLAGVLERFPVLETKLTAHAGSLSGGQQQMLAIARGLIGAPRLLMLDEPSLGLAPLVVEQIKQILLQLKAEGMTILLVEQNAALALSASDSGYVLVNGRVTLDGTAEELAADDAVRSAYLGREVRPRPTSAAPED